MEDKIKVWVYKCLNTRCNHTNYFMVGGGADIVCRSCFGYGFHFDGEKMVTEDELKRAMHPGDYRWYRRAKGNVYQRAGQSLYRRIGFWKA